MVGPMRVRYRRRATARRRPSREIRTPGALAGCQQGRGSASTRGQAIAWREAKKAAGRARVERPPRTKARHQLPPLAETGIESGVEEPARSVFMRAAFEIEKAYDCPSIPASKRRTT